MSDIRSQPVSALSDGGGQGWFYVQWHLTDRCNLRCHHCYQSSYSGGDLSEEQCLVIAGELERAMGVWKRRGRISLTGGEPFLSGARLFRLLDFFDGSQSFEWIGILTNGTLIDSQTARGLTRYRRLREVQVSLDGATAETHDRTRGDGSFSRAIRGLACLEQVGISTSIMFTLTAGNYHEVDGIVDLALQLGVGAITIERMTPMGKSCDCQLSVTKEVLKAAYETVARKKKTLDTRCSLRIRTSRPLWCLVDDTLGGFCPAGLMSLCVLHDGTLLPCRRLEIPLGNILTDGLFKVWYTSDVLWSLRQKNRMEETCRTCKYLGKCGGCRAAAFAASGNFLAHDPHCWKGDVF
ncbi:radical SAM protein [Thermopirellula anaerolimosa]